MQPYLYPNEPRANSSPTYPSGISAKNPVEIIAYSPGLISISLSVLLNKSIPAEPTVCFLGFYHLTIQKLYQSLLKQFPCYFHRHIY